MHDSLFLDNVKILEWLWKWAKVPNAKRKLNTILLTRDKWRPTARHVAALLCRVEELGKLCEWAKEVLNREDLNNKLLLAKYDKE